MGPVRTTLGELVRAECAWDASRMAPRVRPGAYRRRRALSSFAERVRAWYHFSGEPNIRRVAAR